MSVDFDVDAVDNISLKKESRRVRPSVLLWSAPRHRNAKGSQHYLFLKCLEKCRHATVEFALRSRLDRLASIRNTAYIVHHAPFKGGEITLTPNTTNASYSFVSSPV